MAMPRLYLKMDKCEEIAETTESVYGSKTLPETPEQILHHGRNFHRNFHIAALVSEGTKNTWQ